MSDIHALIGEIAAAETQLQQTQFLAPCVGGGKIKTRVAGMVYTFTPQPPDFCGWGIFQPVNGQTAKLVETADRWLIDQYLQQFPAIRLHLACRMGQHWLAYPVNGGDMQQRLGWVKPVVVYLVKETGLFEPIIARWDGVCCWFEDEDRRADPQLVEKMQAALERLTPVKQLHFKGITPEMRTAYELATQQIEAFSPANQDRRRLEQALQTGGGKLRSFQDRGDYWTVDWTTDDGERHTSAIAKHDLTVVSSGICLSGKDQDFDLQSLVGVIEERE